MHSLASHLEKLTSEKEKKNVRSSSCLSPCNSPVELLSEPVIPIGHYLVPLTALEGEPTTTTTCLDSSTGEHLSCRVYDLKVFQSKSALFSSGSKGVHPIREVLLTKDHAFVFTSRSYGDLHQYLKEKKRLTEVQAAPLFKQIVELVGGAHAQGIALRDIKLKKFVFADSAR